MAVTDVAPSGRISIILALAMTLAAPVIGYAAIRNAALDVVGDAADPSTLLPPKSIWPQLKALMRTAREPESRLPKNARLIADRAAVKLPLAYEPYYIAARIEERAGRYRRATVLMEEARRRRPSATSVRVALLGYYSLADAYQKAIDEADMAMRINGRSMSLILPAFAKLVAVDPKARKAIAVALAKNPPWRPDFLEAAANAKIEPGIAKALVAEVRELAPSRSPEAEESFLVRSLVGAGKYREARELWNGYRAQATPSPGLVTDPTFRGDAAMQPFTWTFRSGQDGTAEVAKGADGARGALEVDYFGDSELALAEQTLAARPGSYRLSTLLTGASSATDIGLAWQLACLPSNKPLGRLQLQPLGERPARRELTVSIPGSGCEGQMLTLVGIPGDVSRTLSAQISEVMLVPASAGRPSR